VSECFQEIKKSNGTSVLAREAISGLCRLHAICKLMVAKDLIAFCIEFRDPLFNMVDTVKSPSVLKPASSIAPDLVKHSAHNRIAIMEAFLKFRSFIAVVLSY